MKSKQRFWSYGLNSVVFTIAVGGSLAIGGYIMDREAHFQLDWTASGAHSLSPKTELVLGQLIEEEREVRALYFQIPTTGERAKDAFFTNQKVEDLLAAYETNSKGRLTYKLVDFYKEAPIVQRYNASPGMTVFERNLNKETLKQTLQATDLVIPSRPPKFQGEEVFTTAISRLLDETRREVCFLAGHEEWPLDSPAPSGMSTVKDRLARENYKPRRIDLLGNVQPGVALFIPRGCLAVVLAGPKQPVTDAEIDALLVYFKGGGGLVLLLDPFTSDAGLSGLTSSLGIEILPGLVSDKQALRSPFNPVPDYAPHPITRPLRNANARAVLRQAVAMRGMRAGAPENLIVQPLLRSSSASKLLRDVKSGPDEERDERTGPFELGLVVNGNPNARGGAPSVGRAVVIGDSDILRNDWVTKAPGNFDLFVGSLHWVVGQEEKITITPKDPDIRQLNVTVQEGFVILLLTAGLLPLAIAIGGGLVWRRRRRRM